MRLGWVLGGALLVAFAGGCTSDGGGDADQGGPTGGASTGAAGAAPASVPPWTEPAAYGFVLARGCDEAAPLGRYRVTVRDGSVVRSERLDAPAAATPSSGGSDPGATPGNGGADPGPATGQDGEEIEAPSLGQLLAMAQTAADDGGQVTRVTDSGGRPVRIDINVSDSGPSGAECWHVTDFAPNP